MMVGTLHVYKDTTLTMYYLFPKEFTLFQWELLNSFLTNGLAHPYRLDESISIFSGFWQMFTFIVFRIEIPVSKC